MSDRLFDSQTIWEYAIDKADREAQRTGHPDRTPDCPSLGRFPEAMTGRWSDRERAHVTGCHHCQR